jgi:hypothetical protein
MESQVCRSREEAESRRGQSEGIKGGSWEGTESD